METDPDDFECCTHGIGFDEDCEWCDLDIAEEQAAARKLTKHHNEVFNFDEPSGKLGGEK